MKLKNLSLILSLALFFAGNVQAQDDFGLEVEDNIAAPETASTTDEEFAEDEIFTPTPDVTPEEKLPENKTDAIVPVEDVKTETEEIEISTPAEEVKTEVEEVELPAPAEDVKTEVEEVELPASVENMSALIKQLDLSDEQLDELKFLSDESRMRQEQLEKSVAQLKAQAHKIEEQNLREFEAVLTSEQKETFEKIKQMKEKITTAE